MIWPTFVPMKQDGSYFQNIYFQRQSSVDVNRRRMSLDLLRKNKSVIWIGLRGIGKSCDLNYIFMELLSHLGEESWLSQVAYRTGKALYTFTAFGVKYSQLDYSDLDHYTTFHKNDHSVLILELQESEMDPSMSMPYILAVAADDLQTKLKTVHKTRNNVDMLISPPDVEEVCLMTEAIMDICPNNDIFEGMTQEEAVSIIRSRALKIGTVPKFLFCNVELFKSRLNEMIRVAKYEFSPEFNTLSFDHIPRDLPYLVAPYFRPRVTDPIYPHDYEIAALDYFNSLCIPSDPLDSYEFHFFMNVLSSYEYRYLSEYVKMIHFSFLKYPDKIKFIKSFRLDYQLAEAVIKFGGIRIDPHPFESIFDRISSEHWEWHENIDYNETLSRNSLLPNDKIPVLPRCSAEINIDEMYYEGDVRELKEDRVYCGSFHSLALYGYLTVDHGNKRIYLYHVKTDDLNKYPVTMTTINAVMEKLCLFDDRIQSSLAMFL